MATPYRSRYAVDILHGWGYTLFVQDDYMFMPKDWPFREKKKKVFVRMFMPGEIYDRKTQVGRYEVSSVHLGTMGSGAYEYETMVFDDEDTDVRPEFATRHQTIEEAEQWHAYVVGKLQAEEDALKIVRRSNDT